MTDQTEQLALELPETHDGRKPSGMKTALSGAANRITRPHDLGSKLVAVVELKVSKAGHEETADSGVLYVETLKVVDLFELPELDGKKLLSAIRQSYRTADGAPPLAGLGVDETLSVGGLNVTTDGSGVVLTEAEQAAIRDDPSIALGEAAPAALEPAVLLFRGGSRGLWPDDWEGTGQSRAPIGGTMRKPGSMTPGDTDQIVEILDFETGETVEKWTDEQENERLLKLEQAQEELEAAEDRKVGDELEAKRQAKAGGAGNGPDDELSIDEDELEGAESPGEAVEGGSAPDVGSSSEGAGGADPGPDPAEETHFPTPDDFVDVDQGVGDVKTLLAGIDDRERVLRLLKAEQYGRGRDLKPRKGVLEACQKRAEELFADLGGIEAPDLGGEGEGFDPTGDEDEV